MQIDTPANPEPRAQRHPENVYLAGRREWHERYGDVVASANNWRLIAFAAMALAFVGVGWSLYEASQVHVVPYVVEVDKLGDEIAVREAAQEVAPDDRIIRASLARWIVDARSVYLDAAAQRKNINELYSMIANGSPASLMMNDFYRTKSPFERAAEEVVVVTVQQTLPVSKDSWRLEWQELIQPRSGGPSRTETWAATITFGLATPDTQAKILANPAGLYIKQVNWSQRL